MYGKSQVTAASSSCLEIRLRQPEPGTHRHKRLAGGPAAAGTAERDAACPQGMGGAYGVDEVGSGGAGDQGGDVEWDSRSPGGCSGLAGSPRASGAPFDPVVGRPDNTVQGDAESGQPAGLESSEHVGTHESQAVGVESHGVTGIRKMLDQRRKVGSERRFTAAQPCDALGAMGVGDRKQLRKLGNWRLVEGGPVVLTRMTTSAVCHEPDVRRRMHGRRHSPVARRARGRRGIHEY